MNGDRLDAHLLARPDDATSDLAAIGDQDLLELARIEMPSEIRHKKHKSANEFTSFVPFVPYCGLIPKSGWPYSTGCPFST